MTSMANDASTSTHHRQFRDYPNSAPPDFSWKKDVSIQRSLIAEANSVRTMSYKIK